MPLPGHIRCSQMLLEPGAQARRPVHKERRCVAAGAGVLAWEGAHPTTGGAHYRWLLMGAPNHPQEELRVADGPLKNAATTRQAWRDFGDGAAEPAMSSAPQVDHQEAVAFELA